MQALRGAPPAPPGGAARGRAAGPVAPPVYAVALGQSSLDHVDCLIIGTMLPNNVVLGNLSLSANALCGVGYADGAGAHCR